MRAKNIPVSGPIIIEKSREFSPKLRVESFQASHGWVFKLKNRFDIKFKEVAGESNSVTPPPGMKPHFLLSYPNMNSVKFFNLDEFGLF